MLSQLLVKDRIAVLESVNDWQHAIDLVCEPLINDGSISEFYKEAIFRSTEELGPYYVVAPKIAMPHARPDEGAIKNALSLLIVKDGVSFKSSENDPVHLVLLLSAADSNQHIELITSISEFFCHEGDVEKVIASSSVQDIIEIIKNY
ncbi:PTS sugar transporter subunit IIA [Endozoicomonas numazuensis]|uniref:PTS system mannitol-specific transporter subunit IIA n=1 Tax=Endozoicomonas numazuensis TaxID=1137799 RepID=A0A081NGP6_9GAMM|nr:PTS sugar transporter subunit IIA [Endozoicomonas numazuensis]KEQ17619.1 PTS system mannitol-specific transporter subunit IIA [Endozoicomonas numazuensis]